MKLFIFLAALLLSIVGYSQSVVTIRGDSTKLFKVGGYNELQVINRTAGTHVGGFLKNIGNGVTAFANAVDSIWIDAGVLYGRRGTDTLEVTGIGGGSGSDNTNVGAGFRLLTFSTQAIKTLFNGYAVSIDSTSNTNGITLKVDTSLIATLYDVSLKLNISDTAAMLATYLQLSDTTNKWVKSVYERGDSIFYEKNGVEVFVAEVGTGGSGTDLDEGRGIDTTDAVIKLEMANQTELSYNELPGNINSLVWEKRGGTAIADFPRDGGLLFTGKQGRLWWVAGWDEVTAGNGLNTLYYSDDNGVTWTLSGITLPFYAGNVSSVKAFTPGLDYNYIGAHDTICRFIDPEDGFEIMTTNPEFPSRWDYGMAKDRDGNIYIAFGQSNRSDSSTRMKDVWVSTAKSGGAFWTQLQANVEWGGGEFIDRLVYRPDDDVLLAIEADTRGERVGVSGVHVPSPVTYKIRIGDVADATKWRQLENSPSPQSFITTELFKGQVWVTGGLEGSNSNLIKYLDKNDHWHMFHSYLRIDSVEAADAIATSHARDMLARNNELHVGFGNGNLNYYVIKDSSYFSPINVRDKITLGERFKFSVPTGSSSGAIGFNAEWLRNEFKVKRTSTARAMMQFWDSTGVSIWALTDLNSTANVPKTFSADSADFRVTYLGQTLISNPTHAWNHPTQWTQQSWGKWYHIGRMQADTFWTPIKSGKYALVNSGGAIYGAYSGIGNVNQGGIPMLSYGLHAHPTLDNIVVSKFSARKSAIQLDSGRVDIVVNFLDGADTYGKDYHKEYSFDEVAHWPWNDNTVGLGKAGKRFNQLYTNLPSVVETDTTNYKLTAQNVTGTNGSVGQTKLVHWPASGGTDTNFGEDDITFSGNRTHAGNNFEFNLIGLSDLVISADPSGGGFDTKSFIQLAYDIGASIGGQDVTNNRSSQIFAGVSGVAQMVGSNNTDSISALIVDYTKIRLEPGRGKMEIDTLQQAANMADKWVMVWDNSTKWWERIHPDSVGGTGSGQPNIQFQDEGVNEGTAGGVTTVDFVGTGVTASEAAGVLTVTIAPGAATAGGNDTEIQYNNGGSLGGVQAMTYDDGTDVVTVNGGGIGGDLDSRFRFVSGGTATASMTLDASGAGGKKVNFFSTGTDIGANHFKLFNGTDDVYFMDIDLTTGEEQGVMKFASEPFGSGWNGDKGAPTKDDTYDEFVKRPINLTTNFTDVGNVGAGEDDLMTYSIAAGRLATNGDYAEFTMTFDFAANANNKEVKIYYGATLLYASGSFAQNDGIMEVNGKIIRTGATTQRITFSVNTNTLAFSDWADYVTAGETLSGAVTLKATGEATSNDDIVQRILVVKYFPGN